MKDTFNVQVRVSDIAHTALGAEAETRGEGVATIAEAILGDEAWHVDHVSVEATSHDEASERAALLFAGKRHEIASVKRVPDFTRAQTLDCTASEYHADPCPTMSISPSIAKVLWQRSPAHAWLEHPKGGGIGKDPTKAMDAGTIFHRLLLGQGKDYVVVQADDWRTNAAKALRDSARALGKVAVLAGHLAEIERAVEVARASLADHGLELDGQSEVPIAWRERAFGTDVDVQCRCMLDHMRLDLERGRLQLVEVKTITSAHPDACAAQIESMGYDIQRAGNIRAVEALSPEWAGRIDYVFLFCELDAPYTIAPYRLDGEFAHLGEAKWDRCVRRWHDCLSTGRWPGYVEGIGTLSPPRFALTKAQDAGIIV